MTIEYRRMEPPSEQEMRVMREAHARFSEQLLKLPGIHGVGIGYKITDGKNTGELALIVRVYNKQKKSEVDPRELIPPEFSFFSTIRNETVVVPTDVQERPKPVEYPHIANNALEARVRPVRGGYSIGLNGGDTGTIGGWVWDDTNNQIVLLTNNHVLGGTVGGDVLQPGPFHAGVFPADHCADVVRTGTLDATIAVPINSSDVELEIEGIGSAVYETAQPVLNMLVEKSGARTEHTTGWISMVNYNSGHYGSTNDFEVLPDAGIARFAYYGDSGSLIVERTNPSGSSWKRVIGLLWGGDPGGDPPIGNAYAHIMGDVFVDLNLKTVCAGIVEEIIEDVFNYSYAEFAKGDRILQPRHQPEMLQTLVPIPSSRLYRNISRDLEKQLLAYKNGKRASELLHANRVQILELLRDNEVRRALVASVSPFIRDAWTTDEILHRVITDEDADNFDRFLTIVAKRQPNLTEPLRFAHEILELARGNRLSEILG